MRIITTLCLLLFASVVSAQDSLDDWINRVAEKEPAAAQVMQQYRHVYLHRCGGQVNKDQMALIVKIDHTFTQLLYFYKHNMKAEYQVALANIACPGSV